jgi:hypothetical protein
MCVIFPLCVLLEVAVCVIAVVLCVIAVGCCSYVVDFACVLYEWVSPRSICVVTFCSRDNVIIAMYCCLVFGEF